MIAQLIQIQEGSGLAALCMWLHLGNIERFTFGAREVWYFKKLSQKSSGSQNLSFFANAKEDQ